MAFTTLFRGIIGEITSRFSVWTNQMNQNLRRINMRNGGLTCIEQIATFGDLPVSPADGDTYVVTSTKTVYTWYDDPGTWESTQLYVPDIFWDQNNSKFYYYDGVTIQELLTGTLPPANIVYSDSCGAFSTLSTTAVSVTNLNESITTSGGPVEVSLIADGVAATGSYFSIRNATPTGSETRGFIEILRDSVIVAKLPLYLMTGATSTFLWLMLPPSGVVLSDELVAGTYNYEVQAYIDGTVDTDQLILLNFVKLKLHELR